MVSGGNRVTSLEKRKSKLKFETASAVWERGQNRPVVIIAHAAYAEIRLKGMRQSYIATYASMYHAAVKAEVNAQKAEAKAKKFSKKKGIKHGGGR
jgi:hypothetical protein